jgi:hypothetical protein
MSKINGKDHLNKVLERKLINDKNTLIQNKKNEREE